MLIIRENVMYPSKNEFGIQIDAIKNTRTKRNLNPQHPSWNKDAAVFLAKITHSTTAWKQASTKLILISTEGPIQADPPPEASLHCKASGNTSTSFLAVKRSVIAKHIHVN